MWKLKIAEGGSPWLRTVNNHVGRQVWEFDPKLGSPEDLLEIEKARQNFHDNRFTHKHSADLLMRIHVCLLLSLSALLPYSLSPVLFPIVNYFISLYAKEFYCFSIIFMLFPSAC